MDCPINTKNILLEEQLFISYCVAIWGPGAVGGGAWLVVGAWRFPNLKDLVYEKKVNEYLGMEGSVSVRRMGIHSNSHRGCHRALKAVDIKNRRKME